MDSRRIKVHSSKGEWTIGGEKWTIGGAKWKIKGANWTVGGAA